MNKRSPYRIIILIVILIVFLLYNFYRDNYERNRKKIKALMEQQITDWNEGNLEGYMSAYWKSDKLKFISPGGITYGWQKTLDNYKKGYPDQVAMGTLSFDYLSFEKLGSDHMLVVGKWKLDRNQDTLSGYYTLIWKKIKGNWKIILDNTN